MVEVVEAVDVVKEEEADAAAVVEETTTAVAMVAIEIVTTEATEVDAISGKLLFSGFGQ